MASKIVKSSKGSLHKIAENDISYFGQNINTNAGGSIGETGEGGIVFARPESGSFESPSFEFPNYSTSFSKTIPQNNSKTPVIEASNTENIQEDAIVDDDKIKLTIAVFFDGTLNNKYNTNSRVYYDQIKVLEEGDKLSNPQKEQAEAFGSRWFSATEGSYLNDLSNVARLEKFYKTENINATHFVEAIYVEGVGTKDGTGDSVLSAKDGEGTSGIRTKVKKSIDEIAVIINAKIDSGVIVEELIFNVYGFSRGAATARNFVHEVTQQIGDFSHEELVGRRMKKIYFNKPLGLLGNQVNTDKIERVTISFAGLFDTVSAHDMDGVDKGDKHNDVEELHLNTIKKAKKIVHFVAEDEHRINFSLTKIPRGIEKEFPGVHADIGGCYETGPEKVGAVYKGQVYKLRKEKIRLVDQAWFTETELEEKNIYNVGSDNEYDYSKLIGTRYIYKNYSFIFLELMGLESDKDDAISIKMKQLLDDFSIDRMDKFVVNYKKGIFAGREKQTIEALTQKLKDTLAYTRKRLQSYYFSNDLPMTYYTQAELNKFKTHIDIKLMKEDSEALKILRNKFLHFSADYAGLGMDPRVNKDGERFRERY